MYKKSVAEICAENLTALKAQKKITFSELSKLAHCSMGTVKRWHTGDSIPPVSSLQILANYYGVSIGDLLSTENANEKALLPDEEAIIRLYHSLDSESKLAFKNSLEQIEKGNTSDNDEPVFTKPYLTPADKDYEYVKKNMPKLLEARKKAKEKYNSGFGYPNPGVMSILSFLNHTELAGTVSHQTLRYIFFEKNGRTPCRQLYNYVYAYLTNSFTTECKITKYLL